jgi:hypothetical protein
VQFDLFIYYTDDQEKRVWHWLGHPWLLGLLQAAFAGAADNATPNHFPELVFLFSKRLIIVATTAFNCLIYEMVFQVVVDGAGSLGQPNEGD